MTIAEARQILGVDSVDDKEALQKAWKATSKRTHPDKGGSEAEFVRAREAYELLSSLDKEDDDEFEDLAQEVNSSSQGTTTGRSRAERGWGSPGQNVYGHRKQDPRDGSGRSWRDGSGRYGRDGSGRYRPRTESSGSSSGSSSGFPWEETADDRGHFHSPLDRFPLGRVVRVEGLEIDGQAVSPFLVREARITELENVGRVVRIEFNDAFPGSAARVSAKVSYDGDRVSIDAPVDGRAYAKRGRGVQVLYTRG